MSKQVPTMDVRSTTIYDACNLEVTVATNGYQGGDSGHGSRTELMLRNAGGCDLKVEVLEEGGQPDGARLMLGGDAELYTLIQALKWAATTLEKISGGTVPEHEAPLAATTTTLARLVALRTRIEADSSWADSDVALMYDVAKSLGFSDLDALYIAGDLAGVWQEAQKLRKGRADVAE